VLVEIATPGHPTGCRGREEGQAAHRQGARRGNRVRKEDRGAQPTRRTHDEPLCRDVAALHDDGGRLRARQGVCACDAFVFLFVRRGRVRVVAPHRIARGLLRASNLQNGAHEIGHVSLKLKRFPRIEKVFLCNDAFLTQSENASKCQRRCRPICS